MSDMNNPLSILRISLLLSIFTAILTPAAAEQPEIFVQMGHAEKVGLVGFSPDGKYALAGDVKGITKLWDITNGREIRTLSCYVLAFSRNNRYALLLEPKEKALKLWDMIKKEEINTFKIKVDNELKIISAALSDDGRYIFLGGHSDIGLWDLQSIKEIRAENITKTFTGHKARINSIALSPDGKYALSGSDDKTVRLWDIATGTLERMFEGHGYDVYTAAFSPDDKYILSGSGDHTAKLWDAATGKEIKTLKHESRVSLVAFSPDGKYALTSSNDGIKIWDILTGEDILAKVKTGTIAKIRAEIEAKAKAEMEVKAKAYSLEVAKAKAEGKPIPTEPEEEVYIDEHGIEEAWEGEYHLEDCACSAAFSPDGKHILTGSWRSLNLWDTTTGREIKTEAQFLGYADEGYSAVFSPDGRLVVTATSRGAIVIWDMAEGRKKAEWQSNAGVVAISPDGKFVLSGSRPEQSPGILGLWNITTGKQVWSIEGHRTGIHSLTFSPDGKYALSASRDGTVKLWDIEAKKEVKVFKGIDDDMREAATFSPDGRYVLSVGERINYVSTSRLWNVKSGEQVRIFEWCVPSLAFSPDGKHVICNREIFEVETGKEIMKLEGLDARSLAYSPDGKYILSGGFEDILQLWDAQTGKKKWELPLQSQWIEDVAFSPDGKYVLSASYNGAMNLFEAATGKKVAMFVEFREQKKSFNADKDWVAPDWLVITPEGYFNTSPNGAKHLNVRVGNNVYSIDNFYEKFFNPVYVASVLQGKKVETVADIRKGILTPPDVKIISPEPDASFNTDTISVTVSAKDTGGGLDEIRLYHNGKTIGEDTRAVKIIPKGNEMMKTYTVTLVDGINTFKATGFSKDRTESNPYELIVKLTAPQKDVSLYVLAIGINKYKNPALNLNYAEPDAKGIVEFFRQKGEGLFKKIEFTEMYNEQATKEKIITKLKELENTNPQDAVLLYFAGHGENISDRWYFIPHELTYPEKEEDIKSKGISSDELSGYIKNIKAQKILMLVDACKAGAVLIAFRGFEDRKALSQLSRSTGVHIIAASTKDQFAAEVKDLGHGVFTYTLLEGLKGKASGGSDTVTVRKLMGYIEEQLPEITKKFKQEAQYPVVDSRGMDFPLVLTK